MKIYTFIVLVILCVWTGHVFAQYTNLLNNATIDYATPNYSINKGT